MIQGAGSNVGKSVIVAGLCRALTRRGLAIRPFKPQNMSNNSAATPDGNEIGRAQALQARACRVEACADMNPVLLKPESETGAQIVVRGQYRATMPARDYSTYKAGLMPEILASFRRLASDADLVIVEGAGSPAEINLRRGDIANMGFARAAKLPVILIGDIDRGGVIAQLVGTKTVLDPADAAMIRGFVINKFRGDPSLFADAAAEIARHTGWADLGLVPWFESARALPAEDSLDIPDRPPRSGPVKIVCLRLPRIANFDDLDPLRLEPDLSVEMLPVGQPLPADTDLVFIPGSKSTRGDLAFLKAQGWDTDIVAHHRRGGRILGICGGYQMLGRSVEDPGGLEGAPGSTLGIGLLDVTTTLRPRKSVRRTPAKSPEGLPFTAYEIHLGVTDGADRARPFAFTGSSLDRPEGAISPDGRVAGTYLHGLFSDDRFRGRFLATLADRHTPSINYQAAIESTLDALADHLETHLDIQTLLTIAR